MDTKKNATPAAKVKDDNASQDVKRHPVRTLRVEDCIASIWSRALTVEGADRVFYSVTLERSYKDRKSQTCYTKTFDLDSLPKVAKLCQQAQQAIEELQAQ